MTELADRPRLMALVFALKLFGLAYACLTFILLSLVCFPQLKGGTAPGLASAFSLYLNLVALVLLSVRASRWSIRFALWAPAFGVLALVALPAAVPSFLRVSVLTMTLILFWEALIAEMRQVETRVRSLRGLQVVTLGFCVLPSLTTGTKWGLAFILLLSSLLLFMSLRTWISALRKALTQLD